MQITSKIFKGQRQLFLFDKLINVSEFGVVWLHYHQQSYKKMDDESTKSVTLDSTGLKDKAGLEGDHLINTAKVLKGHKLKTQDFIKLQLMRFRYCSPVRYEDLLQQTLADMAKTTHFTQKYQGMDQEEENQFQKLLTQQRERKAKQANKGLKIFNTHNFDNAIHTSKTSFYKTQNTIKSKPATSQQQRNNYTKRLNKTLSVHKTEYANQQKGKIQFLSENLGKRMNQFMNQMMVSEFEPENIEEQPANMKKVNFQEIGLNKVEKSIVRQKKKPQNAYMKQMKKRFKPKYGHSLIEQQTQRETHYVLKDFPQFNNKNPIVRQNSKDSSESNMFYSIQLHDSANMTETKARKGYSKEAVTGNGFGMYGYNTISSGKGWK